MCKSMAFIPSGGQTKQKSPAPDQKHCTVPNRTGHCSTVLFQTTSPQDGWGFKIRLYTCVSPIINVQRPSEAKLLVTDQKLALYIWTEPRWSFGTVYFQIEMLLLPNNHKQMERLKDFIKNWGNCHKFILLLWMRWFSFYNQTWKKLCFSTA